MKKKMFVIGLVIALLIGPVGWSASAQDGDLPLEEQIDLAIDSGVSWLANEQHPDGSWGGWEQTAVTCFALVKLEERAYDLGYPTPFDPEYEYADNIIAGWNYVFQPGNINKQTPLPVQWHNGTPDDPDSNANGYGVYFYTWGGHPTYTTGICLMALAASGTPAMPNQGGIDFNGDSNPDTYQELAQEAVDWLAFGQADIVWSEGGWGYGANDNAND